ncbi:ABC transporter substrate-binding protein [Nocardioides sp. zg-DK7169]|uniref:ABC transporter substrate-binding protein n=1 Tax=Nocardioides sp. zg-DK7169 TaxID=2736600 RepID=UPI0015537D57|nr:ABC transporter substrate-binding protein [Nocardioides sp. zg-DK7169]NPC95336.1 ABC transporter substrate-binding protein [Nocardioides sp. zg-DK7169]
MIRSTRARRAAVALAATALVLTACGSEDDDSDNNATDNESSTPAAKGDGVLNIGMLLPQTGDLAYLGPPEFAGVELAIKEINEAGGVNGKPVKSSRADSGDGTPDIAGASVDSLLGEGVDTIIGAAASGVSLSVIDKITGAGIVQFSPANTAAAFDTYDDKGMYFRTAPSDRLQGQVLANMAVEDGFSNVAVVARQDAYGEGLAEQVVDTLEEQGATVAADILYAADAQNFTAEVNELAAAKPDAIVLVAFNETTKIIPQLISKGLGPQDVQLYFVDGNMADYSSENFDLTGVKGTFPAPGEVNEDFNDRLLSIDKGLKDFTYGPQSYDATMLTALAAIAAGDDSGEAIASEIVNVSKDGEACSTFADCVELLEAGEDINYEGVSGPCDMNESGSPSAATIGIQEYKGNKYTQIDSVSGVLE